MNGLTLIVPVKDLDKSIDFYRDVLHLHKGYTDKRMAYFSFGADESQTTMLYRLKLGTIEDRLRLEIYMMGEKFIKNEQLNFIRKQIALTKDSTKKNVPPNVLDAVISLANSKIMDLFPNKTLEQQEMLDLSKLKSGKEYEEYIQQLEGYLQPFPQLTEERLKKLFPKQKKLKLPDLSAIDHDKLTYLSWNDVRSNKKFIIHELDGKMVGIVCQLAPTSTKNICSFCNNVGEVAYFSTITKAKKMNNPDYYKSIGNLICVDSSECNKKITDVDYLETFLKESLGV